MTSTGTLGGLTATLALLAATACAPSPRFVDDAGSEPDTAGDTGGAAACVVDGDCDDAEPCNGEETCREGVCASGAPPADGTACVTFLGAPGTCRASVCIPLTCGDGVVDAGEECDDADLAAGDGCEMDCTFTCHAGEECDDANPCTADACEAGGDGRVCTSTPLEGPCDDGDPCTEGDSCVDGVCVPGEAVCECEDDADCAVHDDGDLCNGVMACQGGVCRLDPETIVTCDTPPPGSCRSVRCDPDTGLCASSPLSDVSCDDGDPCSGPDVCIDGTCVGTGEVDCDDANPCTDEHCDAESGCVIVPRPGRGCDDGDACTVDDRCGEEGECAGGAERDCSDGDPCTDDHCDADTGCYHTFNEAPCDDGDACTTGDVCFMGSCVGDELPVAYADADADGFGISWDTVCTDELPDGHAWENGDCCDSLPEVFPGQASWFAEPFVCDDAGLPDFDYDCSGTFEKRWTALADCAGTSEDGCVAEAGWLPEAGGATVPPCGHEGRWLVSCTPSPMGCWPGEFEWVTQECR
jgi:cysteine-rich repeat protein